METRKKKLVNVSIESDATARGKKKTHIPMMETANTTFSS